MIPTLRPYQESAVERVRDALRRYRRVLLVVPTGGGKTVVSAFMTGSAVRKGNRVAFVCHRRELIKQTAKTYSEVGIPFGIVSAGITGDRRQPVQLCGVQTLAKRLDQFTPPNVMIWDEAHHVASASWASIMNAFPDARHIGLTATPERLDGQGLGKFFDCIVEGPSVEWLIENGFLAPYRMFAPSSPDLEGVRTTAGDFNRADVAEAVSKPQIIGDAVSHYLRLAPGKRNMVFCASVKHSLAVVERFQAAGLRAAHIDGETDSADRDRMIEDFAAGRIQVLSSVDLVSEGFDLPAIEVATLLRPTKSLSLYLQQVGRVLRTYPGKTEAIILDHAGNSARHGLPDDPREWSLEGRAKRRKTGVGIDDPTIQVKQCPQCYSVHRPAPCCPRCGFEYPVQGRNPEEVEGELQEIAKREANRERKIQQGRAQTLDELIQVGRLRGYRYPEHWAKKIFEAREQKRGPA